MKIQNITILFTLILFGILITNLNTQAAVSSPPTQLTKLENTIATQARGLNPKVLKLGLRAYTNARKMGMDQEKMLTIVDYSLPSAKPRMWVIDMHSGKVLIHTLVAHGKGSGLTDSTHFSNQSRSDATSIGVYLTGNTYNGKHGYSMRLIGLDPGFNNNALKRDIVMHSAWYVSKDFATKHGRLGRSWGCMALNKNVAPKVISDIKGGSIILAYAPNQNWIHSSRFLTA